MVQVGKEVIQFSGLKLATIICCLLMTLYQLQVMHEMAYEKLKPRPRKVNIVSGVGHL
jgi:hypothetical protein